MLLLSVKCRPGPEPSEPFLCPRVSMGFRIAGSIEYPTTSIDIEHDGCRNWRCRCFELVSTPRKFFLGTLTDAVADRQRSCLPEILYTIGIGIKGILVMRCGKARRSNRCFREHIKLDDIEKQIQCPLIL